MEYIQVTPERLAEIRAWYEWAKGTPEPTFGDLMSPEQLFVRGRPGWELDAQSVREMRHTVLGLVGDLLAEVENEL